MASSTCPSRHDAAPNWRRRYDGGQTWRERFSNHQFPFLGRFCQVVNNGISMISSIRTKILLIAAGTVFFSLVLTSGVIYALVRADSLHTIRQNLESLATANALAVAEWSHAKALAIVSTAAEIDPGDSRSIVKSLMKSGDFSLVAAGWEDKSFISTTPGLPRDFDPTTRSWYQESIRKKPL